MLTAGLEIGSSLDIREVPAVAARHLCAVTDAATCDIYGVSGDVIEALASSDAGVDDPAFVGTTYSLAGSGLQRLAVETRRPVASDDVLEDARASELDRQAAREWGYRSTLDLPLIARGRVVGLASLYSATVRPFAHPDVFSALAQTVAQAIANATLYRDLAAATEGLKVINEVGLELGSTLRPECGAGH